MSKDRKVFSHKPIPAVVLFWGDLILFICSNFIIWWLQIGTFDGRRGSSYLVALMVGILVFTFLAFSENIYSDRVFRRRLTSIYAIIKVTILTFGVLLFFAFLFKVTATYSRLWAVGWASLLLLSVIVFRLIFAKWLNHLRAHGELAMNAVVVGDPSLALGLCDRLCSEAKNELNIIGFLGLAGDFTDERNRSKMYLGNLERLDQLILEQDIKAVFMAFPEHQTARANEISRYISQRAVGLFYMPENLMPFASEMRFEKFGDRPFVQIAEAPLENWKGRAKRGLDLCLSPIALVILSPVFLLTAVAIKIESRGPILFVQDRYGLKGELIPVFKFRSMYHAAQDRDANTQTVQNDDRVTQVGKFIRRTSIDELPQLFNVLNGSMSLVGPRPHATKTKANGKLFPIVVEQYASRHRVKPGVTGWAQVNGWRGETDTEEKILKRVEFDLYYINNWSIYLDLFILVKTLYVVLFEKENSY